MFKHILVIQNMIHQQPYRNSNPKNTKQNALKFAKEICMTQKYYNKNKHVFWNLKPCKMI